jgi:hypothetical protein
MNKRLPIGIQDFVSIREEGFLYVDKTAHIHKLINGSGRTFFLSRPRRFGKSLLLSTLEAFFKGRKNLFTGLYITDKTDWNVNYPVIKLDWTTIGHATKEKLENGIIEILERIGKSYQIDLKISENAAKVFEQLIFRLHEKTGHKVVVLVDEYDVPILDNLSEPNDILEPIREFLQSFYRILKASDEYLHFVFLTGITKFAKVSVFSALNNLIDITMDNEYAAICGLTQNEVENNFAPYIEQIAKENEASSREVLNMVQYWYNGFSWDGHTFVYNPFSTLLLFMKKTFENYWFATATPTFLVEIIKERNDIKYLLEPVEVDGTGFDTFDYKALDTKLLLFQTGYLTVKDVKKGQLGVPLVYILGIPNNEVRNSLLEYMVSSYASWPVSDTAILRDRMRKQILNGETGAFEESAKELFAKIPYQLHIPREAYYHSLLLLWLSLLGFEVQGEVSTNKGRIDAVWTWEDHTIVTEVKFAEEGDADRLLQEALAKINEKEYIERYKDNIHKITLLAIGFTGKTVVCKMEKA